MKSRFGLLVLTVAALIASVVAPAAVPSRAGAQQQTNWYVNDNPSLNGPSRYWWAGDAGSGYGSNNYRFTYAAGGESNAENWARWSMGRRVGRQEIQVYVPHTKATATVVYRIDIGGTVYTARLRQRNAYGWTSLGSYDADGARVSITLRDNDASQHSNRDGYSASRIGVDAARMRCISRCSPTTPTTPPVVVEPRGGCDAVSLGAVGGSVSRGGSWDLGCGSSRRGSDHAARQYSFVLDRAADVRVDLESAVDTFLYLSGSGGGLIAQDDDGGSGTNSRIERRLDAGAYVVEATTYVPGVTGSFTLRARALTQTPGTTSTTTTTTTTIPTTPPVVVEPRGGCDAVSLGAVGGSVSRGGSWDLGCGSSRRGRPLSRWAGRPGANSRTALTSTSLCSMPSRAGSM